MSLVAIAPHFPFGPLGSTVSGQQCIETVYRTPSGPLPMSRATNESSLTTTSLGSVALFIAPFNASWQPTHVGIARMRFHVMRAFGSFASRISLFVIRDSSHHSTHAHSAEAVVAEVSRENATSSQAFRPSRIIPCPPLNVHPTCPVLLDASPVWADPRAHRKATFKNLPEGEDLSRRSA